MPVTRPGGERGATLVETAFVISVFFLFLFGLIDLGLGVFQTSQASAAARDGARFAILHYDQTASVQAEATRRLAGQAVDRVDVTCLEADGTPKPCTAGSLEPGRDRVRVEVAWAFRPLTFVGAPFSGRTIAGTATMAVVGSPTAPATPTTSITVPTECSVLVMAATPPTVNRKGNGQLHEDVLVTAQTNAAPTCDSPVLRFDTGTGVKTLALVPSLTPGTVTATIGAGDYTWTTGAKTLDAVNGDGTVLGSATLTVS